jgi:hypothetical protein
MRNREDCPQTNPSADGSTRDEAGTFFVDQVVHVVAVEWSTCHGGDASTALLILGMDAVVLAVV